MMHQLTMTERDWQSLQVHMAASRDERMAFGFCNGYMVGGQRQHLLASLDLCQDSEYRRQARAGVVLPAKRAVPRLVRARGCASLLDVHSHPFADYPTPSGTDELGALEQARRLRDLAPGTSLVRMVMAGSGRVWADATETGTIRFEPVRQIIVLGTSGRTVVTPVNAPSNDGGFAATSFEAFHIRTQAVLGDEGTRILAGLPVLIIGLGGVGSAVARLLAGYVPSLMLVDPDDVESHNAPRLHFYSHGDAGANKAAVVRREILRAFPESKVTASAEAFPGPESIEFLKRAGAIFCCPDHNAVRYAAAREAARYLKPLIEIGCGGRRRDGVISAMGYHVRLQVPGGVCLPCNGLDLSSLEDPASTSMKRRVGYFDDAILTPGELMSLTTRAASDGVELFLRYVTGYVVPIPRHLYCDALRLQSVDVTSSYAPRPGCPLCGDGDGSVVARGEKQEDDAQILQPPGDVYATV
jgi:molybdopterin/thiamine biosynthesis adenylyltransferase